MNVKGGEVVTTASTPETAGQLHQGLGEDLTSPPNSEICTPPQCVAGDWVERRRTVATRAAAARPRRTAGWRSAVSRAARALAAAAHTAAAPPTPASLASMCPKQVRKGERLGLVSACCGQTGSEISPVLDACYARKLPLRITLACLPGAHARNVALQCCSRLPQQPQSGSPPSGCKRAQSGQPARQQQLEHCVCTLLAMASQCEQPQARALVSGFLGRHGALLVSSKAVECIAI